MAPPGGFHGRNAPHGGGGFGGRRDGGRNGGRDGRRDGGRGDFRPRDGGYINKDRRDERGPPRRDGGDRRPPPGRRGPGGPRGGPGGVRPGSKVLVEPFRFPGVFMAHGRKDMLLTKSFAPGTVVYGEKRIQAEEGPDKEKIEYREWNPYRSKLGAALIVGIRECFIRPGCKLLYLGAASGTTVSHCSDMVGPEGVVYAVEFSPRSARDLITVAKQRPNIVPILGDASHPWDYRFIVPMVDCIFSDVAQPDQTRIVGENAKYFLKEGGGACISIKASCVNSMVDPEVVFSGEIEVLKEQGFMAKEKLPIESFHRHHAIITGTYRK